MLPLAVGDGIFHAGARAGRKRCSCAVLDMSVHPVRSRPDEAVLATARSLQNHVKAMRNFQEVKKCKLNDFSKLVPIISY